MMLCKNPGNFSLFIVWILLKLRSDYSYKLKKKKDYNNIDKNMAFSIKISCKAKIGTEQKNGITWKIQTNVHPCQNTISQASLFYIWYSRIIDY